MGGGEAEEKLLGLGELVAVEVELSEVEGGGGVVGIAGEGGVELGVGAGGVAGELEGGAEGGEGAGIGGVLGEDAAVEDGGVGGVVLFEIKRGEVVLGEWCRWEFLRRRFSIQARSKARRGSCFGFAGSG